MHLLLVTAPMFRSRWCALFFTKSGQIHQNHPLGAGIARVTWEHRKFRKSLGAGRGRRAIPPTSFDLRLGIGWAVASPVGVSFDPSLEPGSLAARLRFGRTNPISRNEINCCDRDLPRWGANYRSRLSRRSIRAASNSSRRTEADPGARIIMKSQFRGCHRAGVPLYLDGGGKRHGIRCCA
jgi:hypothetical protein